MPNDDALALVRRMMARDRWAAAAGARLVELREGYARVTMRLRDEHLNGVSVAQGGAVFTLADFAFAAASNSHGTVAVALDTSMTFARPATKGVLTAEAREESLSRRTSVCTVRVTDAERKVVALFRGTAFRRDEPVAALLAGGGPRAAAGAGSRAGRGSAARTGRR
jgi:acyl-CoA thioesterase